MFFEYLADIAEFLYVTIYASVMDQLKSINNPFKIEKIKLMDWKFYEFKLTKEVDDVKKLVSQERK